MEIEINRIRSIQFLPDRIIVEYEKGKVFQFCKHCKDGKHLKRFLNDYALVPSSKLAFLSDLAAMRMERKFYHHFLYGPCRRSFHKLAVEFGEYAKRRCGFYEYRQGKEEGRDI